MTPCPNWRCSAEEPQKLVCGLGFRVLDSLNLNPKPPLMPEWCPPCFRLKVFDSANTLFCCVRAHRQVEQVMTTQASYLLQCSCTSHRMRNPGLHLVVLRCHSCSGWLENNCWKQNCQALFLCIPGLNAVDVPGCYSICMTM